VPRHAPACLGIFGGVTSNAEGAVLPAGHVPQIAYLGFSQAKYPGSDFDIKKRASVSQTSCHLALLTGPVVAAPPWPWWRANASGLIFRNKIKDNPAGWSSEGWRALIQ